MPRLPLPIQPENPQVVLWEWDEGAAWPLAKLESHFPERECTEMSDGRLREHQAVACALTEMMESEGWRVTHQDGKPQLKDPHGTPRSLSISHHTSQRNTTAAVAVWEASERHHGIDLVDTFASSHSPHRPRFMSQLSKPSGPSQTLIAAKEAMFKGHGPNLDFRRDLSVDSMTWEADGGQLIGTVRGARWRGACAQVPHSSLGVVWSSPSAQDLG